MFGNQLSTAFAAESKSSKFSEVQQFRALIRSFGKIGGGFQVEEFHGPNHQVFFNGTGAWGRTPARCELCDVVILAYSLNGGFRCRLTFLQAKLSKEKYPNLCSGYPSNSDVVTFKANLEQWDLLSRRPDVLPVPPFKVQPKVLSDALLASVGSFGVFHTLKSADVGFFYASADMLSVVGTPTSKQGKLTTTSGPRQRIVSGLLETTYCCCLPIFGDALYNLEIGTPIEPVSTTPAGGLKQTAIRSWARNLLSFYIEVGNNDSVIARELRQLLNDDNDDADFPESIPSLILIRSEAAPKTSNPSIQRTR